MRAGMRFLLLFCVLAGCGKTTAAPTSTAVADAPAVERPPILLGDHAFDPDTGAKVTAVATWPRPHSREWGVDGGHWIVDKEERVALFRPYKDDQIVVSSLRVGRMGGTAWGLPPMKETFVAGADHVVMPNGDWLIWSWSHISDSGVELLRLRPDDGHVVFREKLPGAGVHHSEYEHDAHVRLRGERLDVVSVGSSATWVEVVSAATGKRLTRWQPKK